MISSTISRVSAFVLLLGGLALLFASDAVLPALIPGFPPDAAWLGQLLAAAWLGIAALNWLQRSALLGGIYGRATVFANVVTYFISAASVLRALLGHRAPAAMWFAAVPLVALAATYTALMMRGPFDPLQAPGTVAPR